MPGISYENLDFRLYLEFLPGLLDWLSDISYWCLGLKIIKIPVHERGIQEKPAPKCGQQDFEKGIKGRRVKEIKNEKHKKWWSAWKSTYKICSQGPFMALYVCYYDSQ